MPGSGNNCDRSRSRARKSIKHFWHEGARIGQTVAASLQGDNSDLILREVLLRNHAAVHRQQCIKFLFRLTQQFTVLETSPADQRYGFDSVSGKIATQPPVEIFVEKDSHSDRLQKFVARLLQHGNDLLSLYTRKTV